MKDWIRFFQNASEHDLTVILGEKIAKEIIQDRKRKKQK